MINLNLMKNQKRNLKTDNWSKFNETLLAKKKRKFTINLENIIYKIFLILTISMQKIYKYTNLILLVFIQQLD